MALFILAKTAELCQLWERGHTCIILLFPYCIIIIFHLYYNNSLRHNLLISSGRGHNDTYCWPKSLAKEARRQFTPCTEPHAGTPLTTRYSQRMSV